MGFIKMEHERATFSSYGQDIVSYQRPRAMRGRDVRKVCAFVLTRHRYVKSFRKHSYNTLGT